MSILERHNQHIAIIGAGLSGTSAAFYLAKEGYEVTIIDSASQEASASSSNASAILMPLVTKNSDILGKWYSAGYVFALDHLSEVQAKERNIFYQCGVISSDPKYTQLPSDTLCIPSNYVEVIDYHDSKALYFKDGGVVNIQALCSLQLEIVNKSLTKRLHCSVDQIKYIENSQKWHVLSDQCSTIGHFDHVVIANGIGVGHMAQTDWLPMVPVKGQMTYYTKRIPSINHVLVHHGFITPYLDSLQAHAIGATYHRHVIETAVTDDDHQENIRRIARSNVIYDKKDVYGWSQLRYTMPDRRAVVGAIVNKDLYINTHQSLKHGIKPNVDITTCYYPNLYVSTGHGSRGLTSAILSGFYISQMICGYADSLEFRDILRPHRFLERQLKRGEGI